MPVTPARTRNAAAAAGTARKRSRSAAADVTAPSRASEDATDDVGPGTQVAGVTASPANLSPTDTRGIVEAIFLHSKPYLLSEWANCARGLEERMVSAVERNTTELLDPAGPLAGHLRCLVREELDAHMERQPQIDDIVAGVTKDIRAAVIHAIKTTPLSRSTDQMTKAEVSAAVATAVGYKKIRELLPEVLSRRILAISQDDSELHDVTTISFPAASKKRKSYANAEFDKVIKSLVHKLYEQNALKSPDERPPILRNKERLLVHDMDLVDDLILAAARVALHDGRSEARKLFYRLFAFFLMTPGATMKLEQSDADAPAVGAGASSTYFSVIASLRASANGELTDDDCTKVVKRNVCLYDVAAQLLQSIVLQPYPFDPAVVDAVARNLRHILSEGDHSWTNTSMKESEAVAGSGSWGLLLPMLDCRVSLSTEVQTLTPSEKYLLRSVTAPDSSVSAAAVVAPATDPSGASTSDAPAQPSWL